MSYERAPQPRLAGNLVARATSALGIQPCEPCKRRQEWLNQKHLQLLAWLRAQQQGRR